MKRLVRCLIAVPAVLVGLLSAGPALAADPRIPLTAAPVTLPSAANPGEYCQGFTARITVQDFNQYIIRQTIDPMSGATILRITGRARATVTNLTTLKSVSYNISGPGTLVLNSDGSFSGDLHGPNLLWTARANLANFLFVPTAVFFGMSSYSTATSRI